MTKEEISVRIDELETRRFYLAMKDRWNRNDYRHDDELLKEIRELKEMLNK